MDNSRSAWTERLVTYSLLLPPEELAVTLGFARGMARLSLQRATDVALWEPEARLSEEGLVSTLFLALSALDADQIEALARLAGGFLARGLKEAGLDVEGAAEDLAETQAAARTAERGPN